MDARCREGIKRKGRKLKRRLQRSAPPLTITWGRDGWEKFVALMMIGVSLVLQLIALVGRVRLLHPRARTTLLLLLLLRTGSKGLHFNVVFAGLV